MRGYREAPKFGSASSRPQLSCRSVRRKHGTVDTGDGQSLVVSGGGLHTVFGDDGWKWMLTGPEGGR